jgi:hypothetical protein
MQTADGQGEAQAPSGLLVQLAHRAAIVAMLLTVPLIALAAWNIESRPLTVAAVVASDLVVVLAAIGLVAAYRGRYAMAELLRVFFVGLILAQLAVWSLIQPLGVVAAVRQVLTWIAGK